MSPNDRFEYEKLINNIYTFLEYEQLNNLLEKKEQKKRRQPKYKDKICKQQE